MIGRTQHGAARQSWESPGLNDRFDELDDDLTMDEPDQGVLAKTLRNVGLLVVVCLVIAMVIGSASNEDDPSDRDASMQQSAVPKAQPTAAYLSEQTQGQGAAYEMTVKANANGHFIVRGEVNGEPVNFVIDTGATDIILSADDAERIGFRAHQLDYSKAYRSANGIVRGAPVQLRHLRIGQIEMYELPASVNEVNIGISLLGMTFLKRLDGYEVSGDRLVMAW